MNSRLQRVTEEVGSTSDRLKHPPQPSRWEVLSADMRDTEFSGTYEQCVKYLQAQCPTGSCES